MTQEMRRATVTLALLLGTAPMAWSQEETAPGTDGLALLLFGATPQGRLSAGAYATVKLAAALYLGQELDRRFHRGLDRTGVAGRVGEVIR